LPQTLAIAAVGRALREIVDHRFFHLRPYPVVSAEADIGGFGVIVASAPPLPRPAAWSVVD
jgi:hypothetical protein